jgi:hypothetical protein
VPPVPPPLPPSQSKWRTFLQVLGRVTLVTILTAGGVFYYITQQDRHPGAQFPFDPEKKTLVVLGSGWGATNLLKTLDTTDYNVVSALSTAQVVFCQRSALYARCPGRHQSQKLFSLHTIIAERCRRHH